MSMPMPRAGEFCWNELATPNVKAAKEFYGNVFGWEFVDQPMGDMVYTMIRMGNKDIGGLWAIPKEQVEHIPPHWMSYILVENTDAALEKAKKNGATIVREAFNVGDHGRMGIITDPTGAHIALWQPLRMK